MTTRTLTIREMQHRVNKIVATAETWEQAQRLVAEDKEANRLCKEIIRDATGRAWTAKVDREIDAFLAEARLKVVVGRTLADYLG